MEKKLNLAVIQLVSGEDKKENLSNVLALGNEALENGTEFLVLPEVFNCRTDIKKFPEIAENIPGPSLELLIKLAQEKKAWLLAGSLIEKGEDHKIYNTSVLIDNRGRLAAKYSKMHLFDVKLDKTIILESETVMAGKELVLAEVDGIKTGLSICYDLRFPEIYRYYSKKGAMILCIPSSFTQFTGEAHWEVLLRARAIENQCYVLAPNQAGIGANGVPTYGNSMIVDPWGKILARASNDKPEVIYAEVDVKLLETIRQELPALKHRRLN